MLQIGPQTVSDKQHANRGARVDQESYAQEAAARFSFLTVQTAKIKSLVSRGRLQEARSHCRTILSSYVPGDPAITMFLADLDFHLGLYEEAYSFLVPCASIGQTESIWLRLSYAASKLGESYPGQRAYCIQYLYFNHGDENLQAEFPRLLPQGHSPQTLSFLAALGLSQIARSDDLLGLHNQDYYVQEALATQPRNVVAHFLKLTKRGDRGPYTPPSAAEIALIRSHVAADSEMAWQATGHFGARHRLPETGPTRSANFVPPGPPKRP